MKRTDIFFPCLLFSVLLVSGCVHQQEGTAGPMASGEKSGGGAAGNLLILRIEYGRDDTLNEYREYCYDEYDRVTRESVYGKKGNVREIRFFEYGDDGPVRQVVKNRKYEIEEIREYVYEDGLLVEKTVQNGDNRITGHHRYIYRDGRPERESVAVYNDHLEIADEYYYLYIYDEAGLARRETYGQGEGAGKLLETRSYIHEGSKIMREEETDGEGKPVKYFVFRYGRNGDNRSPVADDRLYDEVFSDDVFHEFVVEISGEEWDGMTGDMLDYAKKHPVRLLYQGDGRPYRTGNYRKADFIYKKTDGEEIVLREVGIRTRGNESRRLPEINGKYQKTHFKIKFDETFDLEKGTFEYERKNSRRFAGMKALNFKWSRYNTWDKYANKTKINELFSYRLLEKVGVTVPKMSLATLTFRIDGKTVDYGIYGIVEHVDKAFLKRRYGNDNDGDLYKCLYLDEGAHLTPETVRSANVGVKDFDTNYRPIYDLKTNTKTSIHSDFINFIHNLNTREGDDFIDYIEDNFEVDKFIRFLAMGIYISNLDDYRFLANNYYLYFTGKGKIDFIPYDYDISLGTAWHGEMGYREFIEQDIFDTANIPESWGDRTRRPLVDKILAADAYRNRYVAYLKEFIDPEKRLFLFSEYKAVYDRLYDLYKGKDKNDTADADPMGWKGYEADYFYDKTKNVLDQLGIPYGGYEVK